MGESTTDKPVQVWEGRSGMGRRITVSVELGWTDVVEHHDDGVKGFSLNSRYARELGEALLRAAEIACEDD